MWHVLRLLLLCVTLHPLCAQSPQAVADLRDKSLQLLESTSLSDKAWGVHFIASLHLTDLQDRLVAELRACQRFRSIPVDGPEFAYLHKLFDALIQMDATVPPDALLPFHAGHRAEVIILLARNRDIEPVLLGLIEADISDTEWLAVANILLARRSPKLFEKLLVGLPATHLFEVADHDMPFGRVGWLVEELPAIPPLRRLPDGFPPTGLYNLTRFPRHQSSLLAHGPTNIFFRRTVVPTDGSASWYTDARDGVKTPRIEFRLELLAARTGQALSSLKQLLQPTTRIRWRSDAQVHREIAAKLDEQAADIRSFIAGAKLRRQTDMTSVRLEIRPELDDHRKQKPGRLAVPKPRIIELDLK
jgi:hypothetical protein